MIKSFDDMPLAVYEQLLAIDDNEQLEDTDRLVLRVAVLTDKTEDEVNGMTALEFGALVPSLAFLAHDIPKRKVTKRYEVGGFVLVPTKDVFKMTTAQFLDFQEFSKKDDNKVDILSTFLVPEGKRYCQGYDIGEVREAIRQYLCVSDAVALYAFFFSRLVASLQASLIYSTYLIRKDRTAKKKVREASEGLMRSLNAGAGWTMFLRPLRLLV